MHLKIISVVYIFLTMLCLLNLKVSAAEIDYGINELYDAVPEEALEYIEENNIGADGTGIAEITLNDVFESIINEISVSLKRPLTMFSSLLAVIILSSVLKNLVSAKSDSINQTFSLVCSLTSTVIISTYLSNVLSDINNAISSASGFSLTYIPVIAGIIAVGGHTSTAAVYTSVMMIGVQVLTQITVNVLFPVTSCLIGISAAGGLNKDLKIDKLGDGLRKAIIWVLGLIMTIFIGFLTMQSGISASADSLSLRAARFAVSTSVPFVGGAVSDALSTVKTSVELLKSGVGSFGIVIGCCVLLPVLIDVLCYRFILFVTGIISDIFDTEDIGRMIRCGENVLSIVISIIVCFFVFLIVSTALMLLVCRQ